MEQSTAHRRGHEHLLNATEFLMRHCMAYSKGMMAVPGHVKSLPDFHASQHCHSLKRTLCFSGDGAPGSLWCPSSVHTYSLGMRPDSATSLDPNGAQSPLCLSENHLSYKGHLQKAFSEQPCPCHGPSLGLHVSPTPWVQTALACTADGLYVPSGVWL